MIFQHTHALVISGAKTQTRRLIKPSDQFTMALAQVVIGKDHGRVIQTVPGSVVRLSHGDHVHAVWSGKRVKWETGKEYAVQPGRNAKSIARIRITDIRCEDVRNISDRDVKAEGFEDYLAFMKTWLGMHDKSFAPYLPEKMNPLSLINNRYGIRDLLATQPAERYTAWVLCFELADQS